MNEVKNIHEAIAAIMKEVGYVQKESKPGLGYKYASEAALIAALRPAMVQYDVYMHVTEITDLRQEVYVTKSGSPMNRTTIATKLQFVHAPSGTTIEVAATGEGSDGGDKSANKALTGAYKYALRQTFCIETGDDPDSTPSAEQERSKKPTATSTTKIDPTKAIKAALFQQADEVGVAREDVGAILGAAGFTGDDLCIMSKLDAMKNAIAQEGLK